jgi:putative transposase
LLIDDGLWSPTASEEGKAIAIDLGLLDFAVTSNGSKYQNPRHLKKQERNLKRKQRQLSRKKDKTTNKRRFR